MTPHPPIKASADNSELDRPRFGRLSLIIAGCFVIGLVWPGVAGLNFVQRPPGSPPSKAHEAEVPATDGDPEPSPDSPSPNSPAAPSPRPGSDEGLRAAARVVPATEDNRQALVEASGQATIGWKTAVVREAPSRQAKIAARLLYGTRVNVTGRMGEWYRIERDGGNVGWVHQKAIGM